ncbi:MAG: SRPBCC family protein [Imperialibacter sp.]|uniref:SRPBCC family protein n=1 Tax=Imperialibacter sp. TaxID=2038411 RepID=UPI0030DD8AC2|tara:strand:- start:47701 stop:48129 length:429 start_codon:yes stop_codon:yes gene_type:complete
MAKTPFTIEKTYNAPAKKVWEAITDKDKMKVWYFDLAEFKAEVGFEFRFKGGPPERQYLHICEVTEVIKEKKLAHSWRYDGEPGISYVTWELFDQGNSTLVRLTHANIESFNSGNPDLVPENFAAGWTDIVGRSLREYLEGK